MDVDGFGVEVIILLYVVFKRTGEGVQISANEVSLKEASFGRVELPKQQVKGMRRVGADLVITATSGELVTVRGFFSEMDGGKNDLVLDDGLSGSWLAGLSQEQGELAVRYSSIDPIEPLLMPKESDFGVWPWLLGSGLVAGAAGGGGGGGTTAAPVQVDSAASLSNQQLVMV